MTQVSETILRANAISDAEDKLFELLQAHGAKAISLRVEYPNGGSFNRESHTSNSADVCAKAERLVRVMTDWMADEPSTRFEVVDDAYRSLRDALGIYRPETPHKPNCSHDYAPNAFTESGVRVNGRACLKCGALEPHPTCTEREKP